MLLFLGPVRQVINLIKRIREKFKTFFIRFLASTLRGLAKFKDGLQPVFKRFSKPLEMFGRFLLFAAILPLYKLFTSSKKIFAKFYAPQKIRHRIIHPFSRRYLTHFIIIIIALLTTATNLNAYETRQEDFGKTSIVATLALTEDEGAIAAEGPVTETNKVTHYLGVNGVGATPQVTEDQEPIEILPNTVAGGSAVVKPIISPAEEGTGGRTKTVYYTVQPGDTVSTIAYQFGITINTILWANNLSSYTLIRPGDKIAILPTSGVSHKVAKGDTLARIAKQYNVDAVTILEFNRLASADDIHIGELLIIPGGKKIAAPPVYQPRSYVPPAVTSSTRMVSSGRMLWPVACHRVTQYFSWRHTGVDIACGIGVAVFAADNGRVVKAQGGYNGGYGLMIIIDHGNGIQTLYGHLSKLYVAVGDTISQGQVIAAQGSTGRSTGPHTHFEVRVAGVRRNPLSYVK